MLSIKRPNKRIKRRVKIGVKLWNRRGIKGIGSIMIISISKIKKMIIILKKRILKGGRLLERVSNPHSKVLSLLILFLEMLIKVLNSIIRREDRIRGIIIIKIILFFF